MAAESENELLFSESTLPLITEDSYFNSLPFADDNSDSTVVEDYAKQWASAVSKRCFLRYRIICDSQRDLALPSRVSLYGPYSHGDTCRILAGA